MRRSQSSAVSYPCLPQDHYLDYVRAVPQLSARFERAAIIIGERTSPGATVQKQIECGTLAAMIFLSVAAGEQPPFHAPFVDENEWYRESARGGAHAQIAEPQSFHRGPRQNRGRRQAQASVAPDAASVAAADAAMASLLAEEESGRVAKAAPKRKSSKKKRGGGAGGAVTAYRGAAPADAHATDAADVVDDAAAALAAVHLQATQDPSPSPPPAAAGARALSPTPPAAAPPSPVVYQAAAAPAVRMRECCVCLDDVPASDLLLLLPCAHRCVCAPCADMLALRPPPDRRCPKCRNPFTGVTRVFEDD